MFCQRRFFPRAGLLSTEPIRRILQNKRNYAVVNSMNYFRYLIECCKRASSRKQGKKKHEISFTILSDNCFWWDCSLLFAMWLACAIFLAYRKTLCITFPLNVFRFVPLTFSTRFFYCLLFPSIAKASSEFMFEEFLNMIIIQLVYIANYSTNHTICLFFFFLTLDRTVKI